MKRLQNQHKIRVDYHFHPNLHLYIPFFWRIIAKIKAKRIWKAFEKYNLDVVLISEHSFKKPKTSFEILEKNKPKNAKTIIIPAIEGVTKKGTDVIVFAKEKKDIYSKIELLTPYYFTLEELVDYIKNDKKIQGIVVHPYTLGTTSIIRNNGEKAAINAIRKLEIVEKHNTSTIPSIKIFETLRLNKILEKSYSFMLKTKNLPPKLVKEARITTVGSDAHHVGAIGSYQKIGIPKNTTPNSYFKIITTKQGKFIPKEKIPITTYLITMLTNLVEGIMRKLKLYRIDKPL